MSVIPDKAKQEHERKLKEWPRPESIVCTCGGLAFQTQKGTPQYSCLKCGTSIISWTGFDDPTWF